MNSWLYSKYAYYPRPTQSVLPGFEPVCLYKKNRQYIGLNFEASKYKNSKIYIHTAYNNILNIFSLKMLTMFQKRDHGLSCQSGLLGKLHRSISLEVFTVPSPSSRGTEVRGHVPWISV